MKYLRSRFSSAILVLESYNYPQPFHLHLKDFFRANKKFGSKDRKQIAALCYRYLRLPSKSSILHSDLFKALSSFEVDQDELNIVRNSFEIKEANSTDQEYLISQDLATIESDFKPVYASENYLYQPSFWLKEHIGKAEGYLGLPGCQKGDLNVEVRFPYQVQDLSSQFIVSKISLGEEDAVWDCCAGSGGKSLSLSAQNKMNLVITDVRDGIIVNAQKRMKEFGYSADFGTYDLTKESQKLSAGWKTIEESTFDTIILDAPCSGSGTWFRNPEHFNHFNFDQLDEYANRQRLMLKNTLRFLKPGGSIYYITCSVFEKENGDVTSYVLDELSLTLEKEERFVGFSHKADSMYMAHFVKPLS